MDSPITPEWLGEGILGSGEFWGVVFKGRGGRIISDVVMLLMGWEFISINQYLQGLMFRGLVKRTSQANKAAQDQEEWRLELAKFDFDRIHSTTNLPIGGTIISHNKNYLATLKEDGNLVVYVSSHFVPSNIIWQSNSSNKGKAPYRTTAQADGNLVIYDAADKPVWASDTYQKGVAPYTLYLSDEGNLEWYDSHAALIWESKSTRH